MLHACDDKGLWRCWGEDCCRTNHSNSKYIAETFGTWHFHKEGLVICVRPQSRKSLVRDPGKGTWFIRGGNDDTTTVVSPNVMSSLDVGGWVSAFLAVGRNIKTTFPGLDLKTVLAECVWARRLSPVPSQSARKDSRPRKLHNYSLCCLLVG